MDKDEANEIAKLTFAVHALPKSEHMAGFTGIVCVYGQLYEEGIVSKQSAEGILKSFQEHPEKHYATYENTPYTLKHAWIEEIDETSGRVMAEYKRIDEK